MNQPSNSPIPWNGEESNSNSAKEKHSWVSESLQSSNKTKETYNWELTSVMESNENIYLVSSEQRSPQMNSGNYFWPVTRTEKNLGFFYFCILKSTCKRGHLERSEISTRKIPFVIKCFNLFFFVIGQIWCKIIFCCPDGLTGQNVETNKRISILTYSMLLLYHRPMAFWFCN